MLFRSIVAGITLRFTPGGIIEYAANCSIKEDQKLKPNDVLHWRVIEWACKEGFTLYSLGGAHLFLRKFGGALLTTYRYRLDRTLLRRHELKEKVIDSSLKSYQLLPAPVKKVFGQVSRVVSDLYLRAKKICMAAQNRFFIVTAGKADDLTEVRQR